MIENAHAVKSERENPREGERSYVGGMVKSIQRVAAGEMRRMVRMQVYATPRFRRHGRNARALSWASRITYFAGAAGNTVAFVRGGIARLPSRRLNRIFADNATTMTTATRNEGRNSISFAKSPRQNFRRRIHVAGSSRAFLPVYDAWIERETKWCTTSAGVYSASAHGN